MQLFYLQSEANSLAFARSLFLLLLILLLLIFFRSSLSHFFVFSTSLFFFQALSVCVYLLCFSYSKLFLFILAFYSIFILFSFGCFVPSPTRVSVYIYIFSSAYFFPVPFWYCFSCSNAFLPSLVARRRAFEMHLCNVFRYSYW